MSKINSNVKYFLNESRISCLTTMIEDSQPHSASLHFCNTEDPLVFYFLTEKDSRKLNKLSIVPTKSSLVIGFSEDDMKTLQLEGMVSITDGDDRNTAIQIFSKKFNFDGAKVTDDSVFLKFVPSWWRYSELKSKPKVFISSDDK